MARDRGRLLLHACCGPCTIEPLKLLIGEGWRPAIFYYNPNIHPQAEYRHRLQVIGDYARAQGVTLIEGPYDPERWRAQAGCFGDRRPERCRACYRMRLEESARFAKEHGFSALSTTLTVSPYQYVGAIGEELERACGDGLEPIFRDFRPYYPEATRISRELGMYRQNYCGCSLSDAEAAAERKQRREQRRVQAEKRAHERAEREAELAPQREAARKKREEYDRLQRRKREVRDALRAQRRAQQTSMDQE